MGSDLYGVRVRSRVAARVVLDVRVVHPDAMYLPEDLGFALMLLREGARDSDPLAAEVSFEDTMDAGWLERWARGFLRSVRVVELANVPPPEAEADHEHPYWRDHASWMSAAYEIEATHEAWVAHLAVGARFESRAFDSTSTYRPCDPIAPGATGGGRLLTEGEAFFEIPREVLLRWRMGADVPRVLRHPAYAQSAYRPVDDAPMESLSASALRSWVGGAVRYETRYGQIEDGALVHVGEGLWIVRFSSGSSGCARLPRSDVRWMGRLGFREGARTGERLTLGHLVRRTPPTAIVSRRVGDTVQLAIRAYSERYVPQVPNASHALAVLAAPLVGPADRLEADAPLARALEREKAAGGRPFLSEVYARIAHGYVRDFELRAPARPSWPDVDAMDPQEALARFDALPWPEWELTVRVHDPAWIAHFPSAPFVLEGGWVADAAPWSGPPARHRG